ncbi:alkylhydroperoxidase domain protein [Mycetocola reblochoni]|uniref:Alkylhydroperoxidase AhpD domain protein n=2 Tax=Mycetocola reblochoni TaxID=331618 RepID=A0A1R4K6E4_9MICO|nr:alkylhydroperoxidase domain protein [Mycetocola reblochoni]RLP68009.1 alkylhydroperoxidase domain protein [Mycetocola reblochoni]SJN39692.1 Alkylhydroperoxidase AhpD domain protein [Mycetocola reblochoni REB411]
MSETTIERDDVVAPERFTQESLGWVPWLQPLPKADFTDRHWDGVVDRQRADMPYFALLARDPEILRARTLTDNDIFYNTDGGAPRAERELAAAATSRLNGCVFCASVHSRFASEQSGRSEEVQRLLDEGVEAPLEPRWRAVVDASVALTRVPSAFGTDDIASLRAQGLGDEEISDVIHGAAFFNWANRLMLSLGEPEVPARRR